MSHYMYKVEVCSVSKRKDYNGVSCVSNVESMDNTLPNSCLRGTKHLCLRLTVFGGTGILLMK